MKIRARWKGQTDCYPVTYLLKIILLDGSNNKLKLLWNQEALLLHLTNGAHKIYFAEFDPVLWIDDIQKVFNTFEWYCSLYINELLSVSAELCDISIDSRNLTATHLISCSSLHQRRYFICPIWTFLRVTHTAYLATFCNSSYGWWDVVIIWYRLCLEFYVDSTWRHRESTIAH